MNLKISIRGVTRSGNNVRGIIFFDGIRVAELHCTPNEYFDFTQMLHAGNQVMKGVSEDLEFETP